MVAAAQLATLWLVYIVGNLTSLFFDLVAANGRLDTVAAGSAERLRNVGTAWSVGPWELVHSSLDANLQLDWVSGGVLAFAAYVVYKSYGAARSGSKVSPVYGFFAALRLSIYFFMWLPSLVVVYFVDDGEGADMAFLFPAGWQRGPIPDVGIAATEGITVCGIAATWPTATELTPA